MINIVVAMCVAGDPMFFEFASHSIPSFLRNNPDTDLRIFTDKPNKVERYLSLSNRIGIINIKSYFDNHPEDVDKFRRKGRTEEIMREHVERYGFMFDDVYPASMPAMADEALRGKGYTHILKIDSESYFAGGNIMAMVRKEVESRPHVEVFLVERKHPAMEHYGGGVPGSGFTLWRIGSRFIPEYCAKFDGSQQMTILAMRFNPKVHVHILQRPGYHLVRPFAKAEATGKVFTREMMEEFLPAYIHLFGKNALRYYKTLEEWFGEDAK